MRSFVRIEAESDRLKSELRTERDHTIDAGCRITEIEAEVERLKADLSKFQMSEFHPDWSLLEASNGAILEHRKAHEETAKERDEYKRLLEVARDAMQFVWPQMNEPKFGLTHLARLIEKAIAETEVQ
jgi:cell division septum initiation protein DivIVA